MNVVIFATKGCPHRPHLEQWLDEIAVQYRLAFVEDHPAEADRFGVHRSPTLVIDEEVVFEGLPSHTEFEERLRRGPADTEFGRLSPREHAQPLPEPVPGETGLYRVDATWGTIQPMEVADGVRTVGELEVIEHLRAGRQVVDARTTAFHERGTLPGALSIPHPEARDRIDELETSQPVVFFCNGPQCGQSPSAIQALLEAGYPAEGILYYRGGMHDWMTLGLPTVAGSSEG